MAAEPHESPWMASAPRLPGSEEARGIGPLGLPCGISSMSSPFWGPEAHGHGAIRVVFS